MRAALLENDRWKTVGPGFSDINAFLGTLNFADFRIGAERRKKIASRLAAIEASQRATARMLGVTNATISRDLDVTNVTPEPEKPNEIGADNGPNVANVTPPEEAKPAPKPEPIKAPEPKVPLSPEAEEGLNVIADIVRGKTGIDEVAPPQSKPPKEPLPHFRDANAGILWSRLGNLAALVVFTHRVRSTKSAYFCAFLISTVLFLW